MKTYSLLDKFVIASGFIKYPGKFTLFEDMTLYDLIFQAGSIIDPEKKRLTYLKRADLIRIKDEPFKANARIINPGIR